ncbi:MFS transporter [Clavibacter michiganensis]|uniref:MFS transporter n=1 Tax=Clavibacter michiganensis TaxID=28447 RepID=UPI000D548630|nr:MFS transporter [Clavibacter michiganensis]AWG02624.1 MFS transporter [Clavibacter michiganensis subsp. insidiosus]
MALRPWSGIRPDRNRPPEPASRRSAPTIAVYIAFATNGLMYAALVSRVPALGAVLALPTSELGLLLLCLSAGALSGLPTAGVLVQRFGGGRGITGGMAIATAGLLLLAGGTETGSRSVTAVGLFVVGLGMGIWEVSMNVVGSRTSHLLGTESLLPRLHATLSLGTVAGAVLGALAAAAALPLSTQNVCVAALLVPMGILIGRMVRKGDAGRTRDEPALRGALLASWREPRTLLIGLCILGFALAEGTANEWLAYVLVDGYGTSEEIGAFSFAAFVTAMTAGRLVGGPLATRFGRALLLRASACVALTGLLVVALGDTVPWAMAGALLWGAGAAMGFPVGIAAAGDDPTRAAARVSVVSSLGYAAFLGGPPLLGLLGGLFGIQQAILIVCLALLLAFVTAGATRRR